MAKILFFCGSIRKESVNKKLLLEAKDIADKLGVKTTFADLAEFEMPIYNGDLEAESGLPENAKKLKNLMVQHDAFFITSPEYNSSFSALLKNTIDWVSRPHEKNEASLIAFANKKAAICSASPGALGGLRGLVPLRMLLSNIKVTVIPDQFALGGAFSAFDENGTLKDENNKNILTNVVQSLINHIK